MRWSGLGLVAWWGICCLFCSSTAFAHPGKVDACLGHEVAEAVEYGARADGSLIVPSEFGEYHLHFTSAQMVEAAYSLERYRADLSPMLRRELRDLGSFTVGGHIYDILEYTRQSEAIVHCQGDDEVTHTGIVRVRE